MTNSPETVRRCFLVQEKKHGIYVIDQNTKREFFRTNAGGWFWTGGPDFPFDEHVIITSKDAEYLSSIVETAGAEHQK